MFLVPHCGVLHTILSNISLGAVFRKCGGHTELKNSISLSMLKKMSSGIFGSLVETIQEAKVGEQIPPLTDELEIFNANTYLSCTELKHHDEGGYFYLLLLDIYLIFFFFLLFMVWKKPSDIVRGQHVHKPFQHKKPQRPHCLFSEM